MPHCWKLHVMAHMWSPFLVQAFEYQQASHGRNTVKVLQDYTQKQGSTVNEVIEALKEIGRPDAMQELEESMPGRVGYF